MDNYKQDISELENELCSSYEIELINLAIPKVE